MKPEAQILTNKKSKKMKTKLKDFRVWHTNKFGNAIIEIKASGFRDCFNRLPRKIQDTFFELENLSDGETITREEFSKRWRDGVLK